MRQPAAQLTCTAPHLAARSLEAAAAGSAIDKIAVWDVPYVIGDDLWPRFNQYLADTHEAYKAGRDEELLELFMRLTGGPDADIAAETAPDLGLVRRARPHARQGRRGPQWLQDPHEPTCPHHSVGLGDHRGSDHRAPVGRPPDRLLRPRRESDNRCHPQTERHTLDGQGHVVAPELMARVLKTFFNQ